jgi:K+-transporting ATPase ATPase A chain
MIGSALLQFTLYAIVTMGLAWSCGVYLTNVFTRQSMPLDILLAPIENIISTVVGSQMTRQQNWCSYALSVVIFNIVGGLFLCHKHQLAIL